jgi:hypothetical protein
MKNVKDFAKIKAAKLKLIVARYMTPRDELITSDCKIEIVEDRLGNLEKNSEGDEDMDQE